MSEQNSVSVATLRRNLITKPCGFKNDDDFAESLGTSPKIIQRCFNGKRELTKEEYTTLLRTLTKRVDNNQKVVLDVCNKMLKYNQLDGNDEYNKYIRVSEIYGYAAFWSELLNDVFKIKPKGATSAVEPHENESSSAEIEYDELTKKLTELLKDNRTDEKAFEPIVEMLNELCIKMLFNDEYCQKYGCSKNMYEIAYWLTEYYDNINKEKSVALAKKIIRTFIQRKSLNIGDLRLLAGSAYSVAIAEDVEDRNVNIQLAENTFRFVKRQFREHFDLDNMTNHEKSVFALCESDYAAFQIDLMKMQLKYFEKMDISNLQADNFGSICDSVRYRLNEAKKHYNIALFQRQELLAYPDLTDEEKKELYYRLNISKQNLAGAYYYTARAYLAANEGVKRAINKSKEANSPGSSSGKALRVYEYLPNFISWNLARESAEKSIALHKEALQYWEETNNKTKIPRTKDCIKGGEIALNQLLECPSKK